MVKLFLIGTAGLLLACSNSKGVKNSESIDVKSDVVIEATTTRAYCGGVKPSKETLEELNTPLPASNVKIYLRKGAVNNIENKIDYEFTTDESGLVKTSLPIGTYSIVFENKKDKSIYNQLLNKYGEETKYQTAIDTACIKKYFEHPNAILEVKMNEDNTTTVNRVKQCQSTSVPCSHYKGKIPPSAPPK